MSFYELPAPTAWTEPPSTWSSTSVDEVEACPRRWQLLRSRWGDLDRFPVRPHPAAIEGQIVHEALERLTRACGRRGNPPFGSCEFAGAAADADFFPGFARAVNEWQRRLTAHPRPGPPFRLRATGEELANRAVRMFREQYRPETRVASVAAESAATASVELTALLKHKRALAEMRLTHPKLPFIGVLDRVQHTEDGIEIVDFKTGTPNEKHRKQLLRYALLWWRNTGDPPIRVMAQYLNGAESWSATEAELEEVEADLTNRLPLLTDALRSHPAEARPNAHCHSCAVRARCNSGWAFAEEAAWQSGRGDAELLVTSTRGDYGFLARSRVGSELAVVYEKPIATLVPPRDKGTVLRVVDGVWRAKQSELEIKAWTEIFILGEGRA